MLHRGMRLPTTVTSDGAPGPINATLLLAQRGASVALREAHRASLGTTGLYHSESDLLALVDLCLPDQTVGSGQGPAVWAGESGGD